MSANLPPIYLLPDTNLFSNLRSSAGATVSSPATLPQVFEILSNSRYSLVLPDAIDEEVGVRGPRLQRQMFNDWKTTNASRISIAETRIGADFKARLIPNGADAGERAVAEMFDPANKQYRHLQQADYIIATNDGWFEKNRHHVDMSKVMGVVPLLNLLLQDGTLQPHDYRLLRDGLQSKQPTLPGVSPKDGKPSQLLTDVDLVRAEYRALPGTKVTATISGIGPAIRRGV